jgi:hypothetical protein
VPPAICPDASHRGAHVISKGTRTKDGKTWRRYQCTPPLDQPHRFQVLVHTDHAPGAASIHFPPACPEHPESAVRRHGTYGKGAKQRQRYRCRPADGSKPHTFTPPLSREAVNYGVDDCTTCEELLSPHRGALTGARHTPWHLQLYAKALSDLSRGASYASVSLEMRAARDHVARHLNQAHDAYLGDAPFFGDPTSSVNAEEAKSAWHLAADLVEQYAPLIYQPVIQRVHAREARQREANDRLLAANPGAPLAAPIVYVLDELPIYTRDRKGARGSHLAWSLLAAVEILWRPGTTPADMPRRENRLRLARGYARADTTAWRLVLDELGTRPDFIVADASDAIANAVREHYPPGTVTIIPSLYHLHTSVRSGMLEKKQTVTYVEGNKVPRPELAKHLDKLTRDELLHLNRDDWATWWDDITATVAALGAPIEKLIAQRRIYEERVAVALPVLRAQPHLPASNAAIENRLRASLDPFLTNRKHLYRNIARTNALLDLAVARAQGAFVNLDDVAHLIRQDNEAHGGWAPTPRAVTDPQPHLVPGSDAKRRRTYSSLRNPTLVTELAKHRFASAEQVHP